MTVKEPALREIILDILLEVLEKGKYSHVILSQALTKIPIPGKTGPLLHQACGGRDGRVPDSARLYIKFIFESKSK